VRAFGCAQQLFELGPCLFDGVQVRRVRRQVEQLGSCRFNSFAHSLDLVRTEIVHDHHVANAQFRAQDLIQIGQEYLSIRGRFDGHGGIMPRVQMAPRMVRIFHLPSGVVS